MESEATLKKLESKILVWFSLIYAILSAVGSVFKLSYLQKLYMEPAVFVPALSYFLYLLSKYVLGLGAQVQKLNKIDEIISTTYQNDLAHTHEIAQSLAEDLNSKTYYATYLNPDAFMDGDVLSQLKTFWRKMEKTERPDYKRIFGVYPDKTEYKDARMKAIKWICEHHQRTKHLKGYQIRFLEVECHMVDVAVNDFGTHFSFPFSRLDERGFSLAEQLEVDVVRQYFLRLWDRAKNIEMLC